MLNRSILVPLCCSLLLVGCGTEVGRVPFTGAGTGTASVTLKAGEVDFWTDISVEYLTGAAMTYQIDLQQDGATVASASCNPLGAINVRTSWTETNLGASRSRRGMGKMACTATLAKGGPTQVKATLTLAAKPSPPRLKKADLVLKQ